MNIGILALQGAFLEHQAILKRLGAKTFQIRKPKDLEKDFNGLIIPGGESTAICRLLLELKMFDQVKKKVENGLPVFGTCAGLILLAKRVKNQSVACLGTMDIECMRNAYGRQLGSFKTYSQFEKVDEVPMVFIRAPYITCVGKDVEILAKVDGKIVAARQENQLATAFHPELTDDLTVHRYFLEKVVKKANF